MSFQVLIECHIIATLIVALHIKALFLKKKIAKEVIYPSHWGFFFNKMK